MMKPEELAEIRKRAEAATTDEAISIVEEDVPKLLDTIASMSEEIERLRNVLTHIDELSDEFFNIETIQGRPTFVIKPELYEFRHIIQEFATVPYEAVNADD